MQLSHEELDALSLHADTLRRAVEAFRTQGFVVLENVLDAALVDTARETCLAVLNRKNKDSVALPYELLRRSPFKELMANAIVLDVVKALLGDEGAPQGFRWIRRCPPGGRAIARVHRDTAGLPDSADDALSMQLSADLLLTEFTQDNGATQIWPGTQHTVEADVEEIKSIGERAEREPCMYVTGPAGSVSIRDQRAWHRSGINDTQQDRLMVSMGHWRSSRWVKRRVA